jgi:hypothetical protein
MSHINTYTYRGTKCKSVILGLLADLLMDRHYWASRENHLTSWHVVSHSTEWFL